MGASFVVLVGAVGTLATLGLALGAGVRGLDDAVEEATGPFGGAPGRGGPLFWEPTSMGATDGGADAASVGAGAGSALSVTSRAGGASRNETERGSKPSACSAIE